MRVQETGFGGAVLRLPTSDFGSSPLTGCGRAVMGIFGPRPEPVAGGGAATERTRFGEFHTLLGTDGRNRPFSEGFTRASIR